MDPGISPYRKFLKVLAELFKQYGASEYEDILEEYRCIRGKGDLPGGITKLHT